MNLVPWEIFLYKKYLLLLSLSMIIEKEELDKFKSIYKEEFGVEITDEQAEDKFGRLLDVLGTLFKYTEEKK